VKAAGSKAAVVGIGGSKLGIDAVKSGEVYGTVCYKPEDMGQLAMKVLHEQLTGAKKHEAEFVTYDTPAISKDNVTDCTPQW
jgi:ribose transport system substrate-binding protein